MPIRKHLYDLSRATVWKGDCWKRSDTKMKSNPSFDYDTNGRPYSGYRRADPRIAEYIHETLGNARTVLNVGAGAGSYEPLDRYVVALEPSKTMRAQRPQNLSPAFIGNAENVPFDDQAFDASMAILTIHHWPDRAKGLKEMRRVTKGPMVIMTFDSEAPTEFWIFDYIPEMAEVERQRYGPIRTITAAIGGSCEVISIPVPKDCTDRFQVALYARPEEFLNPEVRQSQSAWKFLPPGAEERFVNRLSEDLKSGEWDRRYGYLRSKATINCQFRLLISNPDPID